MLYDGVLFIGLHLVGGPVWNEDEEWTTLQQDNLRFMYGMINANKGDFRAVVLLGNARPGPRQDAFFKGVLDLVDKSVMVDAPVAYIHANSGSGHASSNVMLPPVLIGLG
jgi:hypothetical protein